MMKKTFCIILILTILATTCILCACHEHEFGEWKTTVEPTCTQNGEKQRLCDCGEKQTEAIPAIGHIAGDWSVDIQPKCTVDGSKIQNCSVCGALLATESVPATGHQHDAVVTAPTCTEDGYTTHTCTCGDSYTDSSVVALGHDFVEHDAKEPTCTETGWEKYETCTRCDYTTFVEIPKTSHEFGSWRDVTPATCVQSGLAERFCNCGERETKELDALGHTYNSSRICSKCGDVDYSKGLVYTLINDGKEAEVSGIGTCKDSHVIISPTYEGVNVTRVAIEAFRECDIIVKVTLPKTIQVIDSYAFYNCKHLDEIEIPEGVKTIGPYALAKISVDNLTIPNSVTKIHKGALSASSIETLTLPFVGETPNGATNNHFGWIYGAENYMQNNIKVPADLINVVITGGTTIARGAFFGCEFIDNITLPNTIQTIGTVAFYECKQLYSINIPSGVTVIDSQTFYKCENLTIISIPTSVTTVSDYAFSSCLKIQYIYYAGSQEDWNKISIGGNNGNFYVDKVVYNRTEII